MEAEVPPVLWDIGEAAEAIQEVLRSEEDAFARRDLDAIVRCYDPNFVEMEGHIQTRLPDMVWYWQKSMAVAAWLTHQITADEFVREGPWILVTEDRLSRSQSILHRINLFAGVSIILTRTNSYWHHTQAGWVCASAQICHQSMKHQQPPAFRTTLWRATIWLIVVGMSTAILLGLRSRPGR